MERPRRFDRTRRRFIGTGIAAGSAVLAGCITGDRDDGESDDSPEGEGSYTVTMAPMGEEEFEGVPENAFVTFPSTRIWQSRLATVTR